MNQHDPVGDICAQVGEEPVIEAVAGGSDRYVAARGHPRLRMRHAPFPVDREARDRWMQLMTASVAETDFPEPVRTRVLAFLDGVATFLINR